MQRLNVREIGRADEIGRVGLADRTVSGKDDDRNDDRNNDRNDDRNDGKTKQELDAIVFRTFLI